MKKYLLIAFIVIGIILLTNLFGQEFSYVGSSKCRICHKTEKQGKQYVIWESQKHSKAYSALSSPDAAPKAQEMGVENPADSPECLRCHGPLYEKAPELKGEGVTCEICHGPGSAYKKLSVMKDHAESVKNGKAEYGSPEVIKTKCFSCHENAHGMSFDFESSWEKIKHPVPEK